MRYHNILHDDMRNGEGLRVVLFVSGCEHHCYNCQNPQTWDGNGGIEFDLAAKEEIFEQLSKDYINGITFSGGDPLYNSNLHDVFVLINEILSKFPTKTIWLYTGYTWDQIQNSKEKMEVVKSCDVLVDGEYIEEFLDVNYPWAGSTNQRVIDVKKSLEENKIVLWNSI